MVAGSKGGTISQLHTWHTHTRRVAASTAAVTLTVCATIILLTYTHTTTRRAALSGGPKRSGQYCARDAYTNMRIARTIEPAHTVRVRGGCLKHWRVDGGTALCVLCTFRTDLRTDSHTHTHTLRDSVGLIDVHSPTHDGDIVCVGVYCMTPLDSIRVCRGTALSFRRSDCSCLTHTYHIFRKQIYEIPIVESIN